MSRVKSASAKPCVTKSAIVALALGSAGAGLTASSGKAALDPDTSVAPRTGLELVVVEADGCIYCDLFRRDVAPSYETSARARRVPMRFADVAEVEREGVALDAPIDSLPTVLLVKNGHEAGRVAGYIGPESFFHFINYLISGAE
jgi:thioredoxin-related protein